MKDLKFKYLIWLLPFLILSSYAKVEYMAERTIEKQFIVSPFSLLDVRNEYGNLELKTWNKNEIAFEIKILAQSSNEKLANNLVKNTKVTFEQSKKRVSAITNRASVSTHTSWWKFWQNKDHTLKTDYTVYLPADTDLSLDNAYGNVAVQDIFGDNKIELKYGKLKLGDVRGSVTLDLKHGEATMGNCGKTNIDAQYSDIKINKTGNLQIKSTHSEISIDETLNANIYSRYDKYELGKTDNFFNEGAYDEINIESARSISISSDYSELTVSNCELSFDIHISHGESTIRNTSAAFREGKLSGAYTDYDVSIAVPFSFDIKGMYTAIDFPNEISISEERKDNNIRHYTGNTGRNLSCTLYADLSYGSLNIR